VTIQATTCRTIVELRGCRQPVYSTEPYADLIDRIQVARDSVGPDMPAPFVQTYIGVRDDGGKVARPCSFDPTLVAMVYAVEDDA
jgi:hypothetical protein